MNLPVWEVYSQVMEILYLQAKDDHTRNLVEKYRKQVLGDSCFHEAPELYHEVGLATELQIVPSIWKSYSMDDRARIMARRYAANMIDLIDAHYKAQDENRKKNKSGNQSEDS